VSGVEEREELTVLNEELTTLYERRTKMMKDASSYRNRAAKLDELAVELTHRARTIRAERDALSARIRIEELELELRALKARLVNEEEVTSDGTDD
jgi:uncharacterized coiled-coil DUF342 family protein